ncbi:MAG: hypothetical protein ACRDS9_17910 [Pseudonocardiaceae bacterium]
MNTLTEIQQFWDANAATYDHSATGLTVISNHSDNGNRPAPAMRTATLSHRCRLTARITACQ